MFKATTLTFAAALLCANCGLAMAQAGSAGAGAGADKTVGSESGPGRLPLLQSPRATSAPQSNMMRMKKTNLNARQKAGRAKHPVGFGRMRQQTR